jgi:DNA-directed RNA polymerase subunit M/transcription elongation factor TFIIS
MEKKQEKLSGNGHVGFQCPRCEDLLEYEGAEVYSETIFEFYKCQGCGAKYSVRYEAVDWREE